MKTLTMITAFIFLLAGAIVANGSAEARSWDRRGRPSPTPSATATPTATSTPSVTPTTPAALLSDTFTLPDGLITNEYAYYNPSKAGIYTSPLWYMNSGSLFARSGAGYTGVPDSSDPNITSSTATDSAVFRMNSKRTDFGNVAVSVRLNVDRLVSTSSTPAVDWDGVHIWLRYQSEEHLYAASVDRRDGAVVVKKKCPGGSTNGGTYYQLAGQGSLAIAYDQWDNVTVRVRNETDGSVTIQVIRGGKNVLTTKDAGVGCAPIRAAGGIGIRGDNAEFSIDDLTVQAEEPL